MNKILRSYITLFVSIDNLKKEEVNFKTFLWMVLSALLITFCTNFFLLLFLKCDNESGSASSDISTVYLIFSTIMLAPVYEEITFRSLIKDNVGRIEWSLFFAGSFLYILPIIMFFKGWQQSLDLVYLLGASLLLFVCIYMTARFILSYFSFDNIFSFKKLWIVHLSSILFALAHIFNHTLTMNNILLILIQNYFIGMFFCFTRIKFGLISSILLQASLNLIVTIPKIFL